MSADLQNVGPSALIGNPKSTISTPSEIAIGAGLTLDSSTGILDSRGYIYPMQFDKAGNLSVADDIAPWQIIPKDGIGLRVWGWCKTLPATTTIIFDIKRSPFNAITGNGAFASIFSPGQEAQIATVDGGANGYSIPTHPNFKAGDIFRLDILQVGTGTVGADITVVLQCNITDTNP